MENNKVIIDVREKDEFQAEHIQDSIHIPLSEFSRMAPGILNQLKGKQVLLLCRSGKRAEFAKQQLGARSQELNCDVFPGGLLEWKRQGKPTISLKKSHLPLMRQVQLVAGTLVFSSSMLAAFWEPRLIAVSAFVGAGLTVAGLTGFCGMAELLSRMPWNKDATITACDREMLK